MNIQKSTKNIESHAIISGIAGGYAAAHAVATFVSPITGGAIALSAAVVSIIFWKFFEKNCEFLEPTAQINLRGLGGILVGTMAGGIGTYKIPTVDGGLIAAAVVVSLFFFLLVKKGGEAP